MWQPSTGGGECTQESQDILVQRGFGANLDYMRPFHTIEAWGGGQGGKGTRGLQDLWSTVPPSVI